MRIIASFTLVSTAACAWCQMGPLPGGMGQGGPPMRSGGMGQGQVQGRGNSQSQGARMSVTETIRLLSLKAVQNDLQIDAQQYSALSTVARTAQGTTLTEDQALSAVGKVLTVAQTTRLTELLVQDMGYGSLALSSVRAKVDLKADQATAITALTSTLDDTKKAGVSSQALASMRTKTNAALAKLLTAEQDAKLRALAGKSL